MCSAGKDFPKSPNASVWENSGKYQGDIVLDDEQIDFLVEQYSGARNGYMRQGILWPHNTVVYQFAAGHFGMGHNFDRYGNNVVSNLGLPYEYTSCMHYGSHAFSANGRPTMDALRAANSVMGPMTHITGWDFQRVDRLYRCQGWRKDEDYQPYYPDPNEGSDQQ